MKFVSRFSSTPLSSKNILLTTCLVVGQFLRAIQVPGALAGTGSSKMNRRISAFEEQLTHNTVT